MTKIDLHNHTTKSDGHVDPFALIDMAAKNGVEVLSITDHDTVAAYSNELIEYAKQKGILLIKGVELSTQHKFGGFHVLGYNIDINNVELLEELQKLRDNRRDYLIEVVQKLAELGFYADYEELSKIEAVTKGNIAESVISNPVNKEILIKTWGHIPTKSEFIQPIMNKGGPAYIRKESITPLRAVELIRKAGGKAVLAHPIAYVYDKGVRPEDVVELIDEIKPDGLETNYVHFDKQGTQRNESQKWGEIAKARGMFETIGSDFHRDNGYSPLVGFVNVEMEFSDEQIEALLKEIFVEQKTVGVQEENTK